MRFLLHGDIGQQLDLIDHEARISRMSRMAKSGRSRDSEQDDRLRELETEVMQLNAGLAAVVSLVRSKGIATDQEIAAALENAVLEAERTAADKASAKQEQAAAEVKEAALRKLERIRRKRSDES